MSYNIEKIREDFPPLNQTIRGKQPIYFDNACMSLKPKQVIEAMNGYYTQHPSCHKRAVQTFGQRTTRKYQKARQSVQEFINAGECYEVIFTRNTTESINLVTNSFPFKKGDVILTSAAEHNSNLLPWQILSRKKGIIHKIFGLEPDFSFDFKKFENILSQGVKLVSVFHTSHITGVSFPVEEIIKLSHQYGALVLLDGAQSIAHQKIDVRKLDIDFFVFSFHKVLGPSGMGALYAKRVLLEKMGPFLVGGETVEDAEYTTFVPSEIPDRFEAGLQNYAGAIGVEAAIRYLNRIKIKDIRQNELKLNRVITEEILKLPRIRIVGPENSELRGSILNFYVENMDSGELAIILDKTNNIMVRSGFHCSHAWHKKHKLPPTIRVSLYFYNTIQEAEVFIQTLKEIVKYF